MADLHRLVYSPKAWVYIKTQERGIVDVSDFVSAGEVNRVVNEVSTATITLRNAPDPSGEQGSPHYGRFTVNPRAQVGEHGAKPWFHPMDPITVYLARFADKPVQVFTGFLDTTPYVQLFPGTITLHASCTLKRLLYTFWDPALPFTRDFLGQFGWLLDVSSGQLINPTATEQQVDARNPQLTDAGFGDLLYAVLNRIGGWRDDQIHIEKLPPGIIDTVVGIYNSFVADNTDAEKQFSTLLERMIGTSAQGSGGGASADPGTVHGLDKVVPYIKQYADQAGIPPIFVLTVGFAESQWNPNASNTDQGGHYGYFQTQVLGPPYSYYSQKMVTSVQAKDLGYVGPLFCGAAKFWLDKNPSYAKEANWQAWAEQVQGSGSGPGVYPNWATNLQQAKSAWNKYKSGSTGAPFVKTDLGLLPSDQNKAGTKAVQVKGAPGTGQYSSMSLPVPSKYIPLKQQGPRFGRLDQGVDIEGYTIGAPMYAMWSGTVHYGHNPGADVFGSANPDGRYPILLFDKPLPVDGLKYDAMYYGHCKVNPALAEGDHVKAGEVIAYGGFAHQGGGGHMEIGFGDPTAGTTPPLGSAGAQSSAQDMFNLLTHMVNGGAFNPTDTGTGQPGGGTSSTTSGNVLSTATASAFATSIEFPGVEETTEAVALQGQKSLMNDKPLLPFVQQLSGASLRHFMSLPNGSFIAFYPDFFGTYNHRAPYWQIDDIEILDGKIELSDDALATHVYVVGDTFPFIGGPGELVNKLASGGVVTIFNAFKSGDWMIEGSKSALGSSTTIPTASQGKGKKGKVKQPATSVQNINSKKSIFGDTGKALAFLQKFGARPLYQEEPFIRSPYFEAFMAFTLFQLAWSKQFLTTFSLTFMPELYPGGRVAFPNHDFACYIDSVTHSFDYTNGFTTSVNFSAPSAYVAAGKPGDPPPIADNPIAQGMIRSVSG